MLGSGVFVLAEGPKIKMTMMVKNNLLPEGEGWHDVSLDSRAAMAMRDATQFFMENGALQDKFKHEINVSKRMMHADSRDVVEISITPPLPEDAVVTISGTEMPLLDRPYRISTSVPGIIDIKVVHPKVLCPAAFVVASG
jgi:hypothetical protein